MELFRHSRGAFSIESSSDAPPMEFVTLRDDDERLYISKEVYNCGSVEEGGFRYNFMIKAFDMAEYVGDEVGEESPLYIELYVVSPEAAGPEKVKEAVDSWGCEDLDSEDHAIACEVLLTYGTSAPVYSLIGGHARVCEDGMWEEPEGVDYEEELDQGVKLMKQHANAVNGLFGFFMDAPVNAIGDTGWDWVAGNIGVKMGLGTNAKDDEAGEGEEEEDPDDGGGVE